MRKALVMTFSPLLLVACMEDMPRPVPGGPPARECRDAGLQRFVGQPMTPRLQARLRAASRATNIRVVRPGEMVTQDFRADRLTVSLNDRGRIERLSCG